MQDLSSAFVVTQSPSEPAIDLGLVKAHLRVTHAMEDAIIATYLRAAVARFERATGLVLLPTVYTLYLDRFPPGSTALEIPRGPLRSVASVTWYAVDDTATVIDAGDYQVDTARGRIVLKQGACWPTALRTVQGVAIQLTLGLAASAAALDADVQRVLLELAAWYFRRPGVEPPDSLLAPLAPVRLA